MKPLLTICLLLALSSSYAQKRGDSNIHLTFPDSTGVREKIRIALVQGGFIVKDLPGDTLSTYPREMSKVAGYTIATAIVSGNKAVLRGGYGDKKNTTIGALHVTPTNYKSVNYYAGSKAFALLQFVAQKTGAELSYSD